VGTTDDFAGMRSLDSDSFFIGRILRAWRIDELPQIWNILKGEMSWVGPRPERPHIVARCEVEIPQYSLRHQVLPGITGLAQVQMPDATPNDNREKLLYDLKYTESASLRFDLKILLQTIRIIYT
jgi:lipopolysaccharide/colanic/teichoic acid biosynthesis glycosyltransferase